MAEKKFFRCFGGFGVIFDLLEGEIRKKVMFIEVVKKYLNIFLIVTKISQEINQEKV